MQNTIRKKAKKMYSKVRNQLSAEDQADIEAQVLRLGMMCAMDMTDQDSLAVGYVDLLVLIRKYGVRKEDFAMHTISPRAVKKFAAAIISGDTLCIRRRDSPAKVVQAVMNCEASGDQSYEELRLTGVRIVSLLKWGQRLVAPRQAASSSDTPPEEVDSDYQTMVSGNLLRAGVSAFLDFVLAPKAYVEWLGANRIGVKQALIDSIEGHASLDDARESLREACLAGMTVSAGGTKDVLCSGIREPDRKYLLEAISADAAFFSKFYDGVTFRTMPDAKYIVKQITSPSKCRKPPTLDLLTKCAKKAVDHLEARGPIALEVANLLLRVIWRLIDDEIGRSIASERAGQDE